MGSSAASAAAGAQAVNALFGSPLSKEALVLAGLKSEAVVSGYHADNIAPAVLGGFVLIRWVKGGGSEFRPVRPALLRGQMRVVRPASCPHRPCPGAPVWILVPVWAWP